MTNPLDGSYAIALLGELRRRFAEAGRRSRVRRWLSPTGAARLRSGASELPPTDGTDSVPDVDPGASPTHSGSSTRLEPAVRNSTVGRLLGRSANRVSSGRADPSEPAGTADVATVTDPTATAGRPANRFERARASAAVVGLTDRGLVQVRRSFLYRWPTAEPDPDVIVIDLRETRSIGPIVGAVDRVTAAIGSAVGGARLVCPARMIADVVVRRPVRLAGLGLLVATTASLAYAAITGAPGTGVVAVHLGLAAVALLATRSPATLSDLRSSAIAGYLAAAFAPPEPPAGRTGRAARGSDGAVTSDTGDEAGTNDASDDDRDANDASDGEPNADDASGGRDDGR